MQTRKRGGSKDRREVQSLKLPRRPSPGVAQGTVRKHRRMMPKNKTQMGWGWGWGGGGGDLATFFAVAVTASNTPVSFDGGCLLLRRRINTPKSNDTIWNEFSKCQPHSQIMIVEVASVVVLLPVAALADFSFFAFFFFVLLSSIQKSDHLNCQHYYYGEM